MNCRDVTESQKYSPYYGAGRSIQPTSVTRSAMIAELIGCTHPPYLSSNLGCRLWILTIGSKAWKIRFRAQLPPRFDG